MTRLLKYLLWFISVGFAVSCIENDLSYPDVVPSVSTFVVAGQKSVSINQDSCLIDIVLEETADISSVQVLSYSFTFSPELVTPIPEYLDLRQPFNFTIRLYQDYKWTIRATRPIARYIECENQAGKADIDAVNKIAYVYVTESQPLSSVRITAMKLEPEGSVVDSTLGFVYHSNPTGYGGSNRAERLRCNFPMVLDCVLMRYFYVDYKGQTIEWGVKFLQKAVEMQVTSVNAWAYSAEVEAQTDGSGIPVIEYRKASDVSWSSVQVPFSSVEVSVAIQGLEPSTDYLVRISNGTDVSTEYPFRTDTPLQLDNMSFDQWHQAAPNDCWYPWKSGTEGVWATANPGVNIAGSLNPTRPEYDHVVTEGGTAARLESITAFGVFAAGNLFTGSFDKFVSMTAHLSWGVPFSSRPYSLKGYYDYKPAEVNKVKEPYMSLKGKSDNMQILVALFADGQNDGQQGPFQVVSSKPGVPDLKTDTRVIAYGALESDAGTSGEYREFECVLEYKDNRRPDYVIVVASSSLRGDYFTGGVGSTLYVDDFSFMYK